MHFGHRPWDEACGALVAFAALPAVAAVLCNRSRDDVDNADKDHSLLECTEWWFFLGKGGGRERGGGEERQKGGTLADAGPRGICETDGRNKRVQIEG